MPIFSKLGNGLDQKPSSWVLCAFDIVERAFGRPAFFIAFKNDLMQTKSVLSNQSCIKTEAF
jgi:hypothetical protein